MNSILFDFSLSLSFFMRPLYFIKIVATFDMVFGFQKRNKYKKANHTGGIGLYIYRIWRFQIYFFPTLFNKKKINIDFEVFISSIRVLIILNCYLMCKYKEKQVLVFVSQAKKMNTFFSLRF